MTTSPAPPPITLEAALFLDFDGTLAPLAPRPQDVRVPVWVLPALRGLIGPLQGAIAIVSGRPIAQLDAFLAPLQLPTAGAHGAESRGASGVIAQRQEALPRAVVACAEALVAAHTGLILEPKPSGLSLHYRARPELETTCRDALGAALAADPDAAAKWGWLHGHFVIELKLRAVSKGHAVRHLLGDAPFAGRQPIFVGDDATDEDGMAAARAVGGYGIRVGGGETQARYRLADPEAVGAWLLAASRVLSSSQPHERGT